MMRIVLTLLAVIWTVGLQTGPARAQAADEVVWVQIEAQPSLATATDRARAYATLLQDVNGFALGGGWYGIAVGPYRRADAELVLRSYRSEGLIPRDSFIQLSSRLRQQFWPVGANVLDRGVIEPPASVAGTDTAAPNDTDTAATDQPSETAPETDPAPTEEATAPTPPPVDETPAEARRSESRLTAEERKQLQIALQWAGFYDSAIDGAFGRGTRSSMAAWQGRNGYEQTGILTTAQRAALLAQYNSVLDGLGLALVRDEKAGIAIQMPTSEVAFDRYDSPFAHYESTGDVGARVLLISQPGDRDTLRGLYDIMQTLEIVPLSGPREFRNDSFEMVGENGRIVSQTEATLENGEIKGFTLIWPAGDEDRRRRVFAEMRKSFARLSGALPTEATDTGGEAIDLLAGLQIRQPLRSASGFFISETGVVATTSNVVQSCTRITLDEETQMQVLSDDTQRNLALLKPETAIAPLATARISAAAPRLRSEVSVAGFSYEGVLSAATMTFGSLADQRGLRGEDHLTRLDMTTLPGDAGGPVFDPGGNVFAMLLPRAENGREWPEDVSFALDSTVLAEAARNAGVTLDTAQSSGTMAPRDLTRQAQDMTVLISCWE